MRQRRLRAPLGHGPARRVAAKFLADRGTHLAAMIAYFALLSFVPLLFLALSLLGLVGNQDESSYLVEQLQRAFPESSVERIVNAVQEIQRRARDLSVIGAIGLVWGSLGLFGALESAFNVVYGLPNRPFARGKALALLLVAASLAVLSLALVAGSLGAAFLRQAGVPGGGLASAFAIVVSTGLVFGLLWSAYTLLTNARLGWRETLPGAAAAAAALEGSFQVVPLFVRATGDLVTLQTFGGLVLLLVWLYLMANIVVLGAEVNWWLGRGRERHEASRSLPS